MSPEPLTTPEAQAALAQIAAIDADPNHASHDPLAPGHAQGLAALTGLYRAAYGTAPVVELDRDPVALDAPPATSAGTGAAQIALPELPDGQQWHQATVDAFVAAAQELNVPLPEVRTWLERFARHDPEAALDREAGAAALREMWGAEAPKRLEAARLVFRRLPFVIRQEIEESGLGNDPEVIRRLAEIGAPLHDARAAIAAIEGDASHPYHDGHHPRHREAVAEVRRLYQRIHGSTPLFTVG